MTDRRPVVLKFGGESLSAPDAVVARVKATRRGGVPVVIVTSAREGVTDFLRALLVAGKKRPSIHSVLGELRRLHPGLPREGTLVLERAAELFGRLGAGDDPDRSLPDEWLSMGERLGAHWLAGVLSDAGIAATPIEADRLGLITDNSYGASRVLLAPSKINVRKGLTSVLRKGGIPVVTGFFGRSLEGRVATLGRGGSDYSASAIGALLGASRVELVKRHVAIFTADPRLVPAARPVLRLSYEEAEEFAQFGARVLHPVTIEPARSARVELRVRSLHNEQLVTSIGPARSARGTRTITLLGPLRSVSLRIAGGRQRAGLLAEVTSRLSHAGINLAAVVTTEAVLGLLVDPTDAPRVRSTLQPFADSMGAVLGRPVPVSLVSAVGDGILSELSQLPPALLARSGGVLATARSISVVVPEDRVVTSLRALHRVFVETSGPWERTAVPSESGADGYSATTFVRGAAARAN